MTETMDRAEHFQQKAKSLRETAQIRHAVPKELLDDLEEANGREWLERVRLKLRSLPIGTFALEQIKEALDALSPGK